MKTNSYIQYMLRRKNNGEIVKNQTGVNFGEPVKIRNKKKSNLLVYQEIKVYDQHAVLVMTYGPESWPVFL